MFKELISLNLPPEDYAIFGSGPLEERHIREVTHDLDIIARGKAWEKVKKLGQTQIPPSENGEMVILFDGDIEIYNKWISDSWDIDMLINTAEIYEGVRVVTTDQVEIYKKTLHRGKDIKDLFLMTIRKED